ncbi:MAG: RICIN domain-containing protein [Marinagarivorans sp.]|nr:RICIN domain-containing protein [Marinagarivorans sp.]
MIFQEDFCQLEGIIESHNAGFVGQGYANSDNAQGAGIVWQVQSNSNQNVTLQWRYANGGTSARAATVSVNNAGNTSASFTAGAWTDWQTLNLTVALKSGSNSIRLSSNSAEGLANIDSLSITGVNITTAACPLPPAKPIAMKTDMWHVLVNRSSGLAMDIDSFSTKLGASLTQWTRTNAENQQFRFVDSGNNYYRLIARHSNLALDILNFNTDDGADIVQQNDANGTNQQFHINDLGNGYTQLVNRLTGKALAPEGKSTLGATRITQYSPNTDLAQQWQIIESAAYVPAGTNPTGECGAGTPKAKVTGSAGNYQMNGTNYGNDYTGAIFAALNTLSSGRTQQERVSIMASGDVGNARINLGSNTIFEVCGTLNAAPGARGTITIWGSRTTNISIPYLKMTGSTSFAILIADTSNLYLGKIDLRLKGGAGIRFDNRGTTSNVKMDSIYVEGTSGHGVETWNIDGLEIGTITARNTGYAGLLLNNTINAKIGTVDGNNTGAGSGYATMRFANTNGMINGSWPTNIVIDKVISRGGARGIFCVSNSGGVSINSIDLADNGNNSILLENCHNLTIKGGTIKGGGELRISARSEFPNTSDITISNLAVSNTSVRESPCGDNVKWNNLSVSGGSRNTCN